MSSLTVNELKHVCAICHFPRSGLKSELITRVVNHFQTLAVSEGDGLEHLDLVVKDDTEGS